MGLFSFLGTMSTVQINVTTLFSSAKKVGTDSFGNRYYEAKARKGYNHPRRWVLYKGDVEATRIPPEWHGWIHYQTDDIPNDNQKGFRRKWQKPYTPNMTGTDKAYRPQGHLLEKGIRPSATGDYEAWSPEPAKPKPAKKTKKSPAKKKKK